VRRRLGTGFLRFESERLTGMGVKPMDLDVDEYVAANGCAMEPSA
jgi:hypothetical protein